jgi:hypothetical protein
MNISLKDSIYFFGTSDLLERNYSQKYLTKIIEIQFFSQFIKKCFTEIFLSI